MLMQLHQVSVRKQECKQIGPVKPEEQSCLRNWIEYIFGFFSFLNYFLIFQVSCVLRKLPFLTLKADPGLNPNLSPNPNLRNIVTWSKMIRHVAIEYHHI